MGEGRWGPASGDGGDLGGAVTSPEWPWGWFLVLQGARGCGWLGRGSRHEQLGGSWGLGWGREKVLMGRGLGKGGGSDGGSSQRGAAPVGFWFCAWGSAMGPPLALSWLGGLGGGLHPLTPSWP